MAPQINQFLGAAYHGIVPTSLGSVDRMGFFTPFSPINAAEYPNSLFQIEDWILGMKATDAPARVSHTWGYNGKLVVNIQSSSKWQTEKSFGTYVEAVKARLGQITSVRASL
jgi:hypothetical protein